VKDAEIEPVFIGKKEGDDSLNKYAIIIDEKSCWGCKACEVACKQENNAPEGIKYIDVTEDGPKPIDGKLDMVYRVNFCRHCDHPSCAEACPVAAITRREDGLVILDEEVCTGCGACVEVCLYEAIAFDQQSGKARKCNLCVHRVDQGLIPACADNVCLAHCITFGSAPGVERMAVDKSWLKERLVEDGKKR
jgi:Fe-S-cluster-containing dehydrogenase component